MFNFGLEPCPMCGGEAEVARLTQGPDGMTAVIKCTDCGLALEWETEIKTGISRTGRRIRETDGMDPIQAWNRRAGCATCNSKIYTDLVAALPSCNDCGVEDCGHRPGPGEVCRINCPLWAERREPAKPPRKCRTCNHASFCRYYDHDGMPTDCQNWEPREE